MRLITDACCISATGRRRPPQRGQAKTSTSNVRCISSAHLYTPARDARLASPSGSPDDAPSAASTPSAVATTIADRQAARGASTPSYRIRFTRGQHGQPLQRIESEMRRAIRPGMSQRAVAGCRRNAVRPSMEQRRWRRPGSASRPRPESAREQRLPSHTERSERRRSDHGLHRGRQRRGRAPRSRCLREFWRVYSYLVVYDSASSPLTVIAVLHGARDVETLLKS
jgi:plasmid stabilization system protein ParE